MPSFLLSALFLTLVTVVAMVDAWMVSLLLPARFSRVRRLALGGAGMCVWLLGHGLIAWSGVLNDPTGMPPKVMPYMAGIAVVVGVVVFGRLGGRLAAAVPWGVWIGLQVFRLPLEVWLHLMCQEGVVPAQMTWSGWNFDVITGASAPFVAWWVAGRKPEYRGVFWVWNAFGLLCLMAIIAIAVTSAPTALNRWPKGPALELVYHVPDTWIVSVLVATALISHGVMCRRALSKESTL